MSNTESASLSHILGAAFRKSVALSGRVKEPDPARYVWDRQIGLSPNAVNYLLGVLAEVYPEPWEAGLHAELVRRLREVKES